MAAAKTLLKPHAIPVTSGHSVVVSFLVISAICELIGTATVAINYYKTSTVAKAIINSYNPRFSVPFSERRQFIYFVNQLTSRWYLTIGLIAYAVGAITGLCAGLAAIYHW
jgi:hypothetical protein